MSQAEVERSCRSRPITEWLTKAAKLMAGMVHNRAHQEPQKKQMKKRTKEAVYKSSTGVSTVLVRVFGWATTTVLLACWHETMSHNTT